MTKIKNWTISKVAAIQARTANEEGQGLAEYGLILALIAVACIVALTALGGGIAGSLGKVTSKL
ncbi:MAG: Flp family type IVb pilin [Anaerolineaceae bacterium]